MLSLKNILIDYRKLTNIDFKFQFSLDKIMWLQFKDTNLMHLLGLHHLEDIEYIQRFVDETNNLYNAKRFVKDIEDEKITLEELMTSVYYQEKSKPRVEAFSASLILDLLSSEKLINFDVKKVKFNSKETKLKDVEYIMLDRIKMINDREIEHFCIGFSVSSHINHPKTFLVEKTDVYVKNQEWLDVFTYSQKPVNAKSEIVRVNWDIIRNSLNNNPSLKKIKRNFDKNNLDFELISEEYISKSSLSKEDKDFVLIEYDKLRCVEVDKAFRFIIGNRIEWNNHNRRKIFKYIDALNNKNGKLSLNDIIRCCK